jgi:hypothetical protein
MREITRLSLPPSSLTHRLCGGLIVNYQSHGCA